MVAMYSSIVVMVLLQGTGVAAEKTERKLVIGKWDVETNLYQQQDVTLLFGLSIQSLVFTETRLEMIHKNGYRLPIDYSLSFDGKLRQIDLKVDGVVRSRGIIAIDGDTMLISLGASDSLRPSSFKTSKTSSNSVYILTRKR